MSFVNDATVWLHLAPLCYKVKMGLFSYSFLVVKLIARLIDRLLKIDFHEYLRSWCGFRFSSHHGRLTWLYVESRHGSLQEEWLGLGLTLLLNWFVLVYDLEVKDYSSRNLSLSNLQLPRYFSWHFSEALLRYFTMFYYYPSFFVRKVLLLLARVVNSYDNLNRWHARWY